MKPPKYKHLQVGDRETFTKSFEKAGGKTEKTPDVKPGARFYGLDVFENKTLPKNIAILVNKGEVVEIYNL